MFDCHFLESYDQKKRFRKKGHTLACQLERMMELGDASDGEAPPPCPRKRDMLKYSWLQMISMLKACNVMMVYRGGQSPSLPKGSTWYAAQYIDYWSRWGTCIPWVILFLWKLIPRKKLWEAYYISDRVHPGGCQGCPAVEEAHPKKTSDVDGVSKTTVHCWIVGLTIHVHCNSLKSVLTEEAKVARLLMALHFRDPVDLTNYCDMLDQIHLDEKWFFLTQEKELSFSWRRKTKNSVLNTNPTQQR